VAAGGAAFVAAAALLRVRELREMVSAAPEVRIGTAGTLRRRIGSVIREPAMRRVTNLPSLCLLLALAACGADAPGSPAGEDGGDRSTPVAGLSLRAARPFLAGEEPTLGVHVAGEGHVDLNLYRASDPVALVAAFDDLRHPTVEKTSLRAELNRGAPGRRRPRRSGEGRRGGDVPARATSAVSVGSSNPETGRWPSASSTRDSTSWRPRPVAGSPTSRWSSATSRSS
jgi:hypothetical protein